MSDDIDKELAELLPSSIGPYIDEEGKQYYLPTNNEQLRPAVAAWARKREDALSTALGQANADLLGCRDGALLRDLRARLADAERERDAALAYVARMRETIAAITAAKEAGK